VQYTRPSPLGQERQSGLTWARIAFRIFLVFSALMSAPTPPVPKKFILYVFLFRFIE
jgi:hypothetical protein